MFKQHQAALGRAGHQAAAHAGGQPADVFQVEAVHVLGGVDGGDHPLGIHVPGQRKLHQDPVDRRIGIELPHQVQELRLRRVGGEAVGE